MNLNMTPYKIAIKNEKPKIWTFMKQFSSPDDDIGQGQGLENWSSR